MVLCVPARYHCRNRFHRGTIALCVRICSVSGDRDTHCYNRCGERNTFGGEGKRDEQRTLGLPARASFLCKVLDWRSVFDGQIAACTDCGHLPNTVLPGTGMVSVL